MIRALLWFRALFGDPTSVNYCNLLHFGAQTPVDPDLPLSAPQVAWVETVFDIHINWFVCMCAVHAHWLHTSPHSRYFMAVLGVDILGKAWIHMIHTISASHCITKNLDQPFFLNWFGVDICICIAGRCGGQHLQLRPGHAHGSPDLFDALYLNFSSI